MSYHVSLSTANNRARAISLVQKAPDDWMAVIKPRNRSDEQNRLMWKLLADVAKSKPNGRSHNPEDWKVIFMASVGAEMRVMHDVDGRPFVDGYRSSKLTVAQMADLITFIQAWGSQNGVTWSNDE